MIVSCPSCTARFNISDASLETGPRRVKCGRCAHVWRVVAPIKPKTAPAARAARPEAASPGFSTPPTPEPTPRVPPRAERGRSTLWIWWLLLLVLIGGIAAAGYFLRGWLVETWPPAERVYDAIGIPLPRIEIDERTEQQVDENGTVRLIVGGVLTNHADRELPVPPLLFILYDSRGEPVNQWPEPPPVAILSPGESVPFTSATGISSSGDAAAPHWDVMLLREDAPDMPLTGGQAAGAPARDGADEPSEAALEPDPAADGAVEQH